MAALREATGERWQARSPDALFELERGFASAAAERSGEGAAGQASGRRRPSTWLRTGGAGQPDVQYGPARESARANEDAPGAVGLDQQWVAQDGFDDGRHPLKRGLVEGAREGKGVRVGRGCRGSRFLRQAALRAVAVAASTSGKRRPSVCAISPSHPTHFSPPELCLKSPHGRSVANTSRFAEPALTDRRPEHRPSGPPATPPGACWRSAVNPLLRCRRRRLVRPFNPARCR
jgi:hypothetical protein